jgi:acyl-coenzyme A thioesterase PaaI-like protein
MAMPSARVHPVHTPLGRFGVETLVDSADTFIATMPTAGLANPLTGHPTLGPLAVLVDYVAGLVNHHRRAPDEWTLSSELTLDLTPDAHDVVAAAPDRPVVATAHPLGRKDVTSFGVCELAHGGTVVGTGSVRSIHIARPSTFSPAHAAPAGASGPRPTDLREIMAISAGPTGAGRREAVLHQSPNSALNNAMGIVHGGAASTGLELVASAAVNAGRDTPLRTASLRVNFVRQLMCGADSRYVGSLVHAGRRSAVADAQAISADGTVALTARLTAYC